MKDINVQYQDNFAYVKVCDNINYLKEKYPEAKKDIYLELLLNDATIALRDHEFVEVKNGLGELEQQEAVFHKIK